MNAPDLLSELRRRGVTVEARGNQLRFRPATAVPPELLKELRVHKAKLLEELRSDSQPSPELDLGNLPAAEIRKARAKLRPKLIRLTGYGEVWLTLTDKMATEVGKNERCRDAPRPVILIENLAALSSKSSVAIRAVLNVMAIFPGSRVIR